MRAGVRFFLIAAALTLTVLPVTGAARARAAQDSVARGLTAVIDIAAGGGHSLALAADGTVWSWGANTTGQLGDGTQNDGLWPTRISNLDNVVAIAAGGRHSLALKSDGAVLAWGSNSGGQLGDGSQDDRLTPVPVEGLHDIVAVTAGLVQSFAISSDGSLWAWGQNQNGVLGDETTATRVRPVQIGGLSPVVSVASGLGSHALAAADDGSVWAWGWNGQWQLGDAIPMDRLSPTQVAGVSGAVRVIAGPAHSFVLTSDGRVWAWGGNGVGQLGDGTTIRREAPVLIGLSDVQALSTFNASTLALSTEGHVMAWGNNRDGQLGEGTPDYRPDPLPVTGLSGMVAIGAGGEYSLALDSDGTVWAWGANDRGQLGDGSTTPRFRPSQVGEVPGIPPLITNETWASVAADPQSYAGFNARLTVRAVEVQKHAGDVWTAELLVDPPADQSLIASSLQGEPAPVEGQSLIVEGLVLAVPESLRATNTAWAAALSVRHVSPSG